MHSASQLHIIKMRLFWTAKRISQLQKYKKFGRLGRDSYELKIPRNIFEYSDKKFRRRFRFSKESFNKILDLIRHDLQKKSNGRHSLTPEVSKLKV